MNCQEIQQLKHASADGELDALRSAEVEGHLRQCAACSTAFENVKNMKTAITTGNLYFKAPAGLEARIRAALPSREKQRPATSPAFNWQWLKWSIAFASTAAIAVLLTVTALNTPESERLAQEVSAGHVRSLMAGHLMDIASTEQHTVKPWFDGKLDFAPPVVDLANDGFPLTGGRLDYLDQRPVAALVFQRQKHVINLFVWPSSPDDSSGEKYFVRNGYNLIHWHQGGMTCWAVSDLNAEELGSFAKLFQERTAAPR